MTNNQIIPDLITLSPDIYGHLFDYLDYNDLVNLKRTSKVLKTYLEQQKKFIFRQEAQYLAKKWMNLELLKRGFKGLNQNAPLVLKNMGLALMAYVEAGHFNRELENVLPAKEKQIKTQSVRIIFTNALDPNRKEDFQQAIQEAKIAYRFIVNDEVKKRQINDMLEISRLISQLIGQIIDPPFSESSLTL